MKIIETAAVFHVIDVDQSVRWYSDVLGFSQLFRFGDYAGVKRDGCILHLTALRNDPSGSSNQPGQGIVYIVCDEIDSYHKLVKAEGASISWEPRDQPYGLRDFGVTDPSGNKLYFGQSLDPANP